MGSRKLSVQILACLVVVLAVLVVSGSTARRASATVSSQLFSATLKNGPNPPPNCYYGGGGWAVPVTPPFTVPECSPPGIVDGPNGVTFVSTEADARSNALINWAIGDNPAFRLQGTVSFDFLADSGTFVGGEIVGDNYGFDQFGGGQSAFAIYANPAVCPDTAQIAWTTLHVGPALLWIWHEPPRPLLELDRWYRLDFVWGGPDNDFEICVDGWLVTTHNLPAGYSLPWGSSPPGGVNFGLGDNHERLSPAVHGSAAGVTFANIEVWEGALDLGCQPLVIGITLEPSTAENPVDTEHTVTATISDPLGVPQVGVAVNFAVTSGPNLGEGSDPDTGDCTANGNCTTDCNGEVSWTYTGSGGLGIDEIIACFETAPDANGVIDNDLIDNHVIGLDGNASANGVCSQVAIKEWTEEDEEEECVFCPWCFPCDICCGWSGFSGFSWR